MGIREIAQEANVSLTTVSRVLNSSHLVNEETRQKVLAVAKKQQYEKNNLFDFAHDFEEIAVIMPNITNSFFARILQGIGLQALKQNFIINLQFSDDDIQKEKKAIDFIVQKKIKGLIFIKCKDSDQGSMENLKTIDKFNIPFVLIDRDFQDSSYSGVFLSNANAVYDSMQLLISKGLKHVVIMGGYVHSPNSKQRLDGYKKALLDNGLEFCEDDVYDGDFSVASGYEICTKILAKKPLPDVIFSLTNELTIGAIEAINASKFTLHEDIKLFSFNKLDTHYVNTLFDISYIEHKVELMGERSIEILKSKFVGTDGSIREILPYEIHYKG